MQVRPAWCEPKQHIALASWREVMAPLAIGASHTSSHIGKGDQLCRVLHAALGVRRPSGQDVLFRKRTSSVPWLFFLQDRATRLDEVFVP